jgi:DNA repair exonuclease SbcCD ATPase subunit
MLEFLNISFNNAFTWKRGNIPLANQGLVLICGRNRDASPEIGSSNGAGKSSVFELLMHALYNTTSKGIKYGGIVNEIVGKDCMIELEFKAQGHHYLVKQYRAHSTFGNKILIDRDGIDVTPHRSPDAKKYVAKIVGLSKEEFLGVVYLSQGSTHTLIEGKGAERRQYISDLFQLYQYDQLIVAIDNRRDEFSGQLQTLEVEATQLRQLTDRLSGMPSLQQLKQECSLLASAIERVTDQNLESQNQAVDLTVLIQKLQQREELENIGANPEAASKLKKKQSRQRVWNKSIGSLRSLQDQITDRQGLQEKLVKLGTAPEGNIAVDLAKHELDAKELPGRVKQAKQRDRIKELIQQELKDLPNNLTSDKIKNIIDDFTNKLIDSEADFKSESSQLTKLASLKDPECPYCLQPVTSEYLIPKKEELSESVEKLRIEVLKLRDDVDLHSKRQSSLEKIDRWKDQVDLLGNDNADLLSKRLNQVQEKLDQLKEAESRASKFRELEGKISVLPDEDLNNVITDIGLLQGKLDKLEEEIVILNEEKTRAELLDTLPHGSLVDTKNTLQRAKRLAVELANVLASGHDAHARCQIELQERENLETDLTKLQAKSDKLAILRHKDYICREVIAALKQLKQKRMRAILKAIQAVLPKYVGVMFSESGLRFELEEDEEENSIDIMAHRQVKGRYHKLPIKRLSGGEKKRLGVALLFTLQQVLSPSKQANLLILDEADDGLDVLGKEAFVSALRLLEGYSSVFVTTQNRSMAESHYFDSIWEVIKENGISTLNQEGWEIGTPPTS